MIGIFYERIHEPEFQRLDILGLKVGIFQLAHYAAPLQECEAVKSLGYTDLDEIVKKYEETPETDVPARDKALSALLKAFGTERYADLEEELLYVEDFEEEDGPVSGLDAEEIAETTPAAEAAPVAAESAEPVQTEAVAAEPEVPAETPAQAEPAVEVPAVTETTPAGPAISQEELLKQQFEQAQAERAALKAEAERAEKEQQLLAKAEARKLLTQPVVQISADQKPAQQTKKDVIDRKTIHPITTGKRYNRGRVSSEGADENAAKPEQGTEKTSSEIKSSLKKILDDSAPQHLK